MKGKSFLILMGRFNNLCSTFLDAHNPTVTLISYVLYLLYQDTHSNCFDTYRRKVFYTIIYISHTMFSV